jgi:hypothetical protein
VRVSIEESSKRSGKASTCFDSGVSSGVSRLKPDRLGTITASLSESDLQCSEYRDKTHRYLILRTHATVRKAICPHPQSICEGVEVRVVLSATVASGCVEATRQSVKLCRGRQMKAGSAICWQ